MERNSNVGQFPERRYLPLSMHICQRLLVIIRYLRQWTLVRSFTITSLVFLFQVFSCQAQVSEGTPIRRLEIAGTQRRVHLETRVGDTLDRSHISREIHQLWSTGWFDDIRVEAFPERGGVGLTFYFVERPYYFLRRIEFKPSNEQLPVKIKTGTPVDHQTAHLVAVALRDQLVEQGHLDAEVKEELVPVRYGQADLRLNLKPGPSYRINEIRFSGPTGFDPETLEHALRLTRIRRILPALPGLGKGWQVLPPFSYQRVETDLEALRSFYFSHGYWDAAVNLAGVDYSGRNSRLTIAVDAGRRYNVSRTQVVKGLPDGETVTSLDSNSDASELCSCLRQALKEAEREGRVDFSVRAEIQTTEGPPGEIATSRSSTHSPEERTVVDQGVLLRARVEAGSPYTVGRIEFRGNHKFSDSTLRRMVVLNEGNPFDFGQLRQSLNRLNSAGFFKPITKDQVIIQRDTVGHQLDLTLNLEERARGSWSFSGSLEPPSVIRPVQFLVGSHLPDWGVAALELSTYFVALSLSPFPQLIPQGLPLAVGTRWMPRFSVGRPYLPAQGWRSGFVISPQLGWQGSLLSSGLMRARVIASNLNDNPTAPPGLAVPVWHGSKEGDRETGPRFAGSLRCESHKSRLSRARSAGLAALDLLGALPMI